MARTSSLGFEYADSTLQEQILKRLAENNLQRLVITANLFPTTLEELLAALAVNQSVEVLKLTAPSSLDEVLKKNGDRQKLLSALGRLPNLQEIQFYGCWKDTYLIHLLDAMDSSRTAYRFSFWWLKASWWITSDETLQALAQLIQRFDLELCNLAWIQRTTSKVDVTPLIQAMATTCQSMKLPLLTGKKRKGDKNSRDKVEGALKSSWLECLLYQDDASTNKVQRLIAGEYQSFREELQVSYLTTLEAFDVKNRSSSLQELKLFVSDSVADYEALVSFVERSTHLVEMEISVRCPDKVVPLKEEHPNTAKRIESILSKRKASLAAREGGSSTSGREKRSRTST